MEFIRKRVRNMAKEKNIRNFFKGLVKSIQYFIQHNKNAMLDEILDRFREKLEIFLKNLWLTKSKNSKKRKNHIRWRKIVLDENLTSNIFRVIQLSLYVASVYSLFHPTFHSYDVISNVRTLNFEWFSKTKTLCKIITVKKSHTSNRNELEQRRRRFRPSI